MHYAVKKKKKNLKKKKKKPKHKTFVNKQTND